MAPSELAINLANYDPPQVAAPPAACTISDKCSKQVTAAQPCNVKDFNCITGQDPSFKNNIYFDSHCLFLECIYPEYRKEFMKAFLAACARHNVQATGVPERWAEYLPTGLQISTQQPTATTTTTTTTTTAVSIGSMTTSSTVKPTAVTVFASASSKFSSPTTTMTSSATAKTENTQPSSTNWADVQIPICGITKNCLAYDYESDKCEGNLGCICRTSNSVSNNAYFKSECLFDSCYSDLGRREWLDAFAYACTKEHILLTDITVPWAPYIPQWYLDANRPPTAPTNTTRTPNNAHNDLSEGAIAGISVAAVAAAIILAVIGVVIWRKDQKLKRKNKEVAQMADAMQPGGVQERIDQLRYGGASSSESETRAGVGPQKEYCAHKQEGRSSTTGGYGHGDGGDGDLKPAPLFHLPSPHSRPSREHDTPYPRDSFGISHSQPQSSTSDRQQPQHYQPYPYERNVGRRVSHRSIADSLGTTAVTTSPVQRYSVEHDANSSQGVSEGARNRVGLRERPSLYDEHGKKVNWG